MIRSRIAGCAAAAVIALVAAPAAGAADAPPPPKPPEAPEVVVRGTPPPPPPPETTAPTEPASDSFPLPRPLHGYRRASDPLPEPPVDAIGQRNVLDADDVAALTAKSVNEIVVRLPSASSRPYNGGDATAPSISLRGLPDDGLTEFLHVAIDGVPASTMPYGWTALSFFPLPPERVWGIDWVRGAHTVRYSPNTPGGVLNFLTPPIPECPTFHARGAFGSYGFHSEYASVGGTWGRFGALVSFVDRGGDGYRDDGDWQQQEVAAKFRYDLDGCSYVAGSYSHMDSEHQAPGGLTQAEFDANRFANARPDNRFEGTRDVADVLWHRDGCASWFEAYAWYADTFRHLHAQRPHAPPVTNFLDWTDHAYVFGIGVRAEWSTWIGGTEHCFHAGLRYERDEIPHWRIESTPAGGGPVTVTRDSESSMYALSLHVDDTFRPLRNLTVNVGARVEWLPEVHGEDAVMGWTFDDDFFRVLPGVGLAYAFSPCVALFGSYYEGFRAPQEWGFSDTDPTQEVSFEVGNLAEVGLRWSNARGFSGELCGWRLEYDDFAVYYSGFYDNLGHIVSQGVDATLEYDLGHLNPCLCGLSLWASATFQDAELRSGPNEGNVVPYAWDEKAAWRARYERFGFAASFGGTYVGTSFADEANTVAPSADGRLGENPAVTLWDARLAKELRLGRCVRLQAEVGATNLFDEEWFVHTRGGFFGPGLAVGAPQEFYGALTLHVDF
jgi:Fe(3+) dicitrate transport protein